MSMIIEDYERLSTITGKMREAAAAGEWDELISLEKRCADAVAALKPRDGMPAEESARQAKSALIRKMLADDKAIREQVEPWMRQLERIMQSSRSEQRLHQTYLANY